MLFLSILFAGNFLLGQSVLFKPGPAIGEDASVMHNDICDKWETTPNGFGPEMIAYAWTYNNNNCGFGRLRSLVRFTELNSLPAGCIITYAELRLFGVPTSGNYGNSSFPGSPYTPGNNDCWIRRVDSAWTEAGVIWNNQPPTTTTDQVATPVSNSRWSFDIAEDVTNQVIDMMAPGQNNGFMLQLNNENFYRGIIFASSDHPDSTLWPELYVEYLLPCNADFSFCTSTGSPGTYKFTVDSVRPGYSYKWYFGDGSTATGTSVSHTYVNGGNYQVCLEVFNNELVDKCRKCIKICVPDLCSASFVTSASHNPLQVFFDPVTDPSPVASYSWDFGDGSTSTLANPSHTYAKDGRYLVCLTVTYENGCVARYCMEVRITTDVVIIIGDDPPIDPGAKTITAAAKADPGSLSTQTGIKVIPNPVNTNSITVTMNAAANGTYYYKIFNAKGEQAVTGSKSLGKGIQNISLDVSALKPGRYWIELSSSKQQLRTGFVKL